MATTISHDGINSGFQAEVIHGNVGNITVIQSETLNQACLQDLRTTNPLDDRERIKNTKGGLLKDSYSWILDNEEFNGKTAREIVSSGSGVTLAKAKRCSYIVSLEN